MIIDMVCLSAGRKRAEIPVYSFEKHARLDKRMTIYSPHVLILEGIFALHDPRILELMDMRVTILAQSICVNVADPPRYSVKQIQTHAFRDEVHLSYFLCVECLANLFP